MNQIQLPLSKGKHMKWIDAWRAKVAAMLGIAAIAVTLAGCGTGSTSASDPISLDYTVHGWLVGTSGEGGIDMGGVVRDFDSSRGVNYYIDNREFTYRAPVIQIDILSNSKTEQIKVAQYLVVETTQIEPMPKELDQITIAPLDTAAAPPADWFYAIFSPQRDKTFPALRYSDYSPVTANEPLEPMYIKPGGRIELTLTTGTLLQNFGHLGTGVLGYYYHFRVGVAYSYEGERNIKWIDDEFVTGSPDKISGVYTYSWSPDSGYQLVQKRRYLDPGPGAGEETAAIDAKPGVIGPPADASEALNEAVGYQDQLSQHIAQQETKVKESSFPLPNQ